MKMNINNLFGGKAGISYLQIFILITSCFAFAYLVFEASKIDEDISVQKKNENNIKLVKTLLENTFLQKIGKWIYNQFSKEIMPRASAQSLEEYAVNCCPKLKSGASCQDIFAVNCVEECAVSCLPTKCEKTTSCRLGCCFNEEEGLCMLNSGKQDCEGGGGVWQEGEACNLQECRLGCCVLGSETQFVTESRCEKLSGFYGLSTDFRSGIGNEVECLILSEEQAEGACIFETENEFGEPERTCKFSTKVECIKITGSASNFFENYLCSNPELETNCEKQQTTNCIEGKDEVYWFDSCGNRENIYSSDKDESWNSGKVLGKGKSCNSDSSNANSRSCGNCNYFLGSRCGKGSANYGNYICQDFNCKDAPENGGGKKDRKNGESWCIYESYIGEGKDVVGSRHYKYYCHDGQVKSEPCGDFRTGICVEDEADTNRGKISTASCRINRATECLQEDLQEDKDKCEKNEDCRILKLDFGKPYEFAVCTPNYPIGFDLSNEEGGAYEEICSQANFKCTKVMEKKLEGWVCISGCECDSEEFAEQMNDWCASLGDCGTYVNVIGEGTDDGASVKRAPDVDVDNYEKYAEAEEGQKAEPGDFSDLWKSSLGWGADKEKEAVEAEKYEPNDFMGEVIGGTAGALGVGAILEGLMATKIVAATAIPIMSGFSNAFIGAAVGAAGIYAIAYFLGITNDPAAIAILTSLAGVGGASLGVSLWILVGPLAAAFAITPIGWALLGVGLFLVATAVTLLLVFKYVLEVGKIKKTKVEFKCNPWQPPKGGDDCNECTEDTDGGLRPCTKYKCQSLGKSCELINEGTKFAACIDSSPDDKSPPEINPLEKISEGYMYTEVEDKGFKILQENGDCLRELSPVIFGIKTDEPAQCKMDMVHTDDYDNMGFYFGESSIYKEEHQMAFNMPSVEGILSGLKDELSEEEIANLQSIAMTRLGNLTFYVRCTDKKGNTNKQEYFIRTCIMPGPDLTAPYIIASVPNDNSYLSYGKTETELTVWINEPADCKYDYSADLYENMVNGFSCQTDFEDVELYGWPCKTNVNVKDKETKIYVKCKDQPWLPDSNLSRNVMQESQIITLKQSEVELNIDKIEPEGEVQGGREPITLSLKAYTSGGVDGSAICEYSFTDSNYIQFFETGGKEHIQVFDMLFRGSYDIFVKCRDIAGNIAEEKTSFKLRVDKNTPKVTRFYNLDGLTILTDEDSECAYTFDSCSFNWANATLMAGLEKEHKTSWQRGRTYYIKCKDLWDNKPDRCSVIIKAI